LPPHQSSARISSRIVNRPACPCRTICTTYRPRTGRNSSPIGAPTELDKYTRLFRYRKKKKSPGVRQCSFATAPPDVRQFAKFALGMVKVHQLQRRQVRVQALLIFGHSSNTVSLTPPRFGKGFSFRKSEMGRNWLNLLLICSLAIIVPSCGSGQQLVSIAIQPAVEMFGVLNHAGERRHGAESST
jgi:hypothetical protein